MCHLCVGYRTAPTAVSEASVIKQGGALGVGYVRRQALANASLEKKFVVASAQVSDCDFPLGREWRGCISSAQ